MDTIAQVISERFGGRLFAGKHDPDGKACIIEAASIARGLGWRDSPARLNCWDIRPLNDAPWSTPERRAEHMIRLYEAYEGSFNWPITKQIRVIDRLIVFTANRIIADAPGLSDSVRRRLRAALVPTDVCAALIALCKPEDEEPVGVTKAARDLTWAIGDVANCKTWAALGEAEQAAWAAASAGALVARAAAEVAGTKAAWAKATSGAANVDSTLIATIDIWLEALEG